MGDHSNGVFSRRAWRRCLLAVIGLIMITIVAATVLYVLLIRDNDDPSKSTTESKTGMISSTTTGIISFTTLDMTSATTAALLPRQQFYVTLDEVPAFTADKLQVVISGNVEYFPEEEDLYILNGTYGLQYKSVLDATAMDALKTVITQFTTRDVCEKRLHTRSAICIAIQEKLDNLCKCNMTSCKNFNYNVGGLSFFDGLLRSCTTSSCNENQVDIYLLFTMSYREDVALAYPELARLQRMLEGYPILSSIDTILTNLVMKIGVTRGDDTVTKSLLEHNILNVTSRVIDYVSSVESSMTLSRDDLPTQDEEIIFAFIYLPAVFKEIETPIGDNVLPPLIHRVTGDQWKIEAQKHNSSPYPWILSHKTETSETISLMIKENIIMNVTTASEGLLGLLGLYYMSYVPYPSTYNGTFLFIQSDVLQDVIKIRDMPLLNRLRGLLR